MRCLGGVDSAVTAGMMLEAGYEVVGLTLQLQSHQAQQGAQQRGGCCSGQDVYDARRVADTLGIAHYVLDFEKPFADEVINDFADHYARGLTPLPCMRCNQRIKFRDLVTVAQQLGAEALATGHYIRRIEGPDGPELHRARDLNRDQSYFLFATTREQLAYLRFPIGDMYKDDVRAAALRMVLLSLIRLIARTYVLYLAGITGSL